MMEKKLLNPTYPINAVDMPALFLRQIQAITANRKKQVKSLDSDENKTTSRKKFKDILNECGVEYAIW